MHNLINLPFFCIRAKWVLNAVYFLQNAFCFLFSVAYLSSAATSTKRFGLFNPPSLLPEHLSTRQLFVATFSLSLHFPNFPSFALYFTIFCGLAFPFSPVAQSDGLCPFPLKVKGFLFPLAIRQRVFLFSLAIPVSEA